MAEDEPKIQFLSSELSAMHCTRDGALAEIAVVTNIESESEQREVISEAYGVEPEYIHKAGSYPDSSIGRVAVGFRRWNSNWDPHAENADPTLN
jgi:hypothetical protein